MPVIAVGRFAIAIIMAAQSTGAGSALLPATGTGADDSGFKRRPAVPPVCASRSDPGLARVRAALLAAAHARSFPMLRDVLAPTFHYTLFEENTADAFVAMASAWSREEQDGFWANVIDALALPLVVHPGDAGLAPMAVAYSDDVRYPHENWLLITGRGVNVRARPSPSAPVVARLSYELVPSWSGGSTDGFSRAGPRRPAFQPVVYDGSKRGWVDGRYAWAQSDFGIYFSKVAGVWKAGGLSIGD